MGTLLHPSSVDLTDGVAMRLANSLLRPSGHFTRNGDTEAALRTGLLADLVIAGRIDNTDETAEIDTSPVGFEPVDCLLAAIDAEPNRSIESWIGYGPVVQALLVRQLEERGAVIDTRVDLLVPHRSSWIHGREYRTTSDPAAVCVEILFDVALGRRSYTEKPDPQAFARCGRVLWLIGSAASFIEDGRRRRRAVTNTMGSFT